MLRKLTGIAFALVVCLISARRVAAAGGKARHKRIYAVPTPGEVRIDGKLDDWDLSSQIHIYVSRATSQMRSAYLAMMYDENAFYIGAKVHDQSPMMNRHDPEVNPKRAWDADVCQIFMSLDSSMDYPIQASTWKKVRDKRLVTMLLWYYTDRQEPNMALFSGFPFNKPRRPDLNEKGVIPHTHFDAAYRKFENEKGYYFEYRIPWKTLEKDGPPPAGKFLAGTTCVFWSGPQGMKTAKGDSWAYDVMRSPSFPYQTAGCWGKIIFPEEGNIPRELVEKGAPVEEPYPLEFNYELPEDGYVTVGLYDEDGLLMRNVIVEKRRSAGEIVEKWTGRTLQDEIIEPGTYEWRGIYHDKITTEFVTSVHNSGTPPYKTDDGTGGWGADHSSPQTAARLGEHMLLAWRVAESGWGIIRVDATGDKKWGLKDGAEYLAGGKKRFFAAGGHSDPGVRVYDAAERRPLNFGSGRNRADFPDGGSRETNHVSGLDFRNGRLFVAYRQRELISINDAKSGSVLRTWKVPVPGRLVATGDAEVLVLSQGKVLRVEEGEVSTFATAHLDEPAGIAADDAGRVYVTNRGELQNVSVFSPEGKYLRSIGTKGGRPRVGRYSSDGMLEAAGCAVGPEGHLWVAETLDGPRRVSVWDTESGENVEEFFGASAYSAFAWMDPEHPDEVYCHNVLWKVDLDTGAKRPWATLWRPHGPNSPPAPMGSFQYKLRVLTAENGHQYAWGKMNHAHPSYLFIRRDDRFVPLMGFIQVNKRSKFVPHPPYPMMADMDEYPRGHYLWVDQNDDQRLQKGEISPIERKYSFQWMDRDLNLYTTGGHIHHPTKVKENGTPVYDFRNPEKVSLEKGRGIWVDPQDGSLYTKMYKYDRDGEMLWGVPGSAPRWHEFLSEPGPFPGDLWGLTCPLGVAGNFTGSATYFGHMHILTRDGIYVSMVMDPPPGQGLSPQNLLCELFCGQLVRPKGMDRYFLLGGDQDGRIMEVHGLNSVRYLEGGTYEVTGAMTEKARTAWQEYERKKSEKQALVIARGGREGLEEAEGISVDAGPNRSFTAGAAYDAENLYVRFEVSAAAGLANSMPDPKTIYAGGNCLDIMLATNPDAPADREKAAHGDVRLVVTRQEGKPRVVMLRPEVEGFEGEPIVLESPVDRAEFDRIQVVRNVKLDYEKRPDGFTATVKIPQDLLEWSPRPGTSVRMDLGYIFGNKTGTNAVKRAYWSDNSFEANVVDDIPDESRLRPAEWGTAVVE